MMDKNKCDITYRKNLELWKFFDKKVKEFNGNPNVKEAYQKFLKPLKNISKEMSSSDYIPFLCAYLIKVYIKKDQIQLSDCRQILDECKLVDFDVMSNFRDFKDFLKCLPKELINEFENMFIDKIDFNSSNIFGHNISVNSFKFLNAEKYMDKESNFSDINKYFSHDFLQTIVSNKHNDDTFEKLLNILKTQNGEDCINILCEIFRSKRAGVENELLDLLGYDHIELVADLVSDMDKYGKLFNQHLNNKDNLPKAKQFYAPKSECSMRPQVVVQTSYEKALQRQLQKDQKRLAKKRFGDNANVEYNENDFNDFLAYQQKQQMLTEVQSEPIYRLHLPSTLEQQIPISTLPFVWDGLSQAKLTSSFMQSNKLNLPEGCERHQGKIYDQIIIPAEHMSDSLRIREPINICDCDQIIRIGFKGVKQLNPIQSIVHDVAYKTNDNMLVCAPTGAGKTNVALLTILNLIRQYYDVGDDTHQTDMEELTEKLSDTDNDSNTELNSSCEQGPSANMKGDDVKESNFIPGMLKKDQFKIVYVAPMKALAAEMTANFGKKLAPFGISVRELTGDMQLTKKEIIDTQMIITTPEKWDVITRKNTGDVALTQLVKLLIIDEVHLLQDTRGPVIEALVARTLRQVETMQVMIRIIGLSATLPSYLHVAKFLRVNPYKALFFFDGRFRPVPLLQNFIGIKSSNAFEQRKHMEEICYNEVVKRLKRGLQILVFVHARNSTIKTAQLLREQAAQENKLALFLPPCMQKHRQDEEIDTTSDENKKKGYFKQLLANITHCRDKRLKDMLQLGIGFHHAGLLRSDRNTVERYFSEGAIRVLVCTATLAWGVNLPAHCVIIKGTEIYDAQAGGFRDMSIIDVTQIFGRAGRPQYSVKKGKSDEYNMGEAILITLHDKVTTYITSLLRKSPIESQFQKCLCDNLNAEIVLGTVSNIEEAVEWLAYTYLHVRMKSNPLAYGITFAEVHKDPDLIRYEHELIKCAAKQLDRARMIRFDETNGYFYATDIGRTASHYYVKTETIEQFNAHLEPNVTESQILGLVSTSSEFTQIKLREEEMDELSFLAHNACPLPVITNLQPQGTAIPVKQTTNLSKSEDTIAAESAKTNILIQAYVSRENLQSFSLISDTNYISQNICRIVRALFEIVLRKGWPIAASRLLNLAKICDNKCWSFQHPLRQLENFQLPTMASQENMEYGSSTQDGYKGNIRSQMKFNLSNNVLKLLEEKNVSIDRLRDMESIEIGLMVNNSKVGHSIKYLAYCFPQLQLKALIQPITRSILRIRLSIEPDFEWNDRIHGKSESWWIWIEDPDNNNVIYHSEYFILTKKQYVTYHKHVRRKRKLEEENKAGSPFKYSFSYKTSENVNESTSHRDDGMLELVFTIPIFEPLPTQYYVKCVSDRWIGSENILPLSFKTLILPEHYPPQTDLLDLHPLPITALQNPYLELLYKFSHFNPIQTQVFHCMYHTDHNALIGAPTGSGKTIMAELAIFRLWQNYVGEKAVYIAPLKALVKERIKDWSERLTRLTLSSLQQSNKNPPDDPSLLQIPPYLTHLETTDKSVNTPSTSDSKLSSSLKNGEQTIKIVELTGDHSPDIRSIAQADLIVTTPEKWDGISRNWQTRNYVQKVTLIIIDEIHMLGSNRGPVLEAIVSRTNYITSHTGKRVRIIGLSTALANPTDLSIWLGIKSNIGLYNFRPSVRPVPLEAHISGFPGKHYCPRMATMNKPTYQAIKTYSPTKPTIIFVSSRRQTRLTALDLIAYLALENDPKQWLKLTDDEIENIASTVKDSNLAHFLLFGIGMHHAGLHERDRKIVEELFVNQKILVLIATSTLAWGVNYPAHLVVIKGTEFYDGKTHKYVDFPIMDVLQMMGRAGRPQYDDQGVAVILVQDCKKQFYKKFLYDPFPVESNLLEVIADHMNAEIVAGTIQSKQEALDYLTWTFFFRRVWRNPSYYGLVSNQLENDTSDQTKQIDAKTVNEYLSGLIENTLRDLENSHCIQFDEDQRTIYPTLYGQISSFYYLCHLTIQTFCAHKNQYFRTNMDSLPNAINSILQCVSSAHEYAEMPVRHNEDAMNAELSDSVQYKVDPSTFDSPHTKVNLLLQCHFGRVKLPCSDYFTDTKSMLDQISRILQALLDIVAEDGLLGMALCIINFMQMCSQALWYSDSPLLMLPHLKPEHLFIFSKIATNIPQLVRFCQEERSKLRELLVRDPYFTHSRVEDIFTALIKFPLIKIDAKLINDSKTKSLDLTKMPKSDQWVRVESNQNLSIQITFHCLNKIHKRSMKAYCPRFPKDKDESWFMILATTDNPELIALKRMGPVNTNRPSTSNIMFQAPDLKGPILYTLYIMSDCYIGLDQQYQFGINIV